jgi:pimeloyl-ACP methyl ester carboxylesterase
MVLILLAFLLADFLSIFLIGLDIYLFREWYLYRNTFNDSYASNCLYGAIAILIHFFAARFLIRMLLSKDRAFEEEPALERSSYRESLTRSDGSKINIEHYGKRGNKCIVLIHGWNSNSMQWFYQKLYFAHRYHLIAIDLPGLRKSKSPANKNFSLENLASVLNDVLEKTKPASPVLWGHSIGGMTILTFCKIYKEKLSGIKGIILQHTTYTNPLKTMLFGDFLLKIQDRILRPMCKLMIIFSPLLWVCRWLSYANGNMLLMTRFMVFSGHQTGKQLAFISLLAAMAPPDVTARGVLGMFEYEASDILHQITVPTLVIAAKCDRLTKAEASQTIHKKIPGSKLITLAAAGHMGVVEQHEEVNNAVRDFLRS